MNWIRKIVNYLTGETFRDLKSKNKRLEEKLVEKQEHINKTNAYWKKKLHEKGQEKQVHY